MALARHIWYHLTHTHNKHKPITTFTQPSCLSRPFSFLLLCVCLLHVCLYVHMLLLLSRSLLLSFSPSFSLHHITISSSLLPHQLTIILSSFSSILSMINPSSTYQFTKHLTIFHHVYPHAYILMRISDVSQNSHITILRRSHRSPTVRRSSLRCSFRGRTSLPALTIDKTMPLSVSPSYELRIYPTHNPNDITQ